MDYKEKYENALKRARNLHKDAIDMEDNLSAKQCEIIFPELAESKDERIRKELIRFLKTTTYINGVKSSDAIAWLEKQGVQKSNQPTITVPLFRVLDALIQKGKPYCEGKSALEAIKEEKVDNSNKIESKFNVGDWIINEDGEIAHINDIGKDNYCIERYYIEFLDGIKTDPIVCFVDEDFHLWTIQDAEDGDVLYSPEYNLLWIYKNKEQCHASINLNYAKSVSFGFDIVIPSDVQPATKKQRDHLFQKMKDAGYEWDDNTKTLY